MGIVFYRVIIEVIIIPNLALIWIQPICLGFSYRKNKQKNRFLETNSYDQFTSKLIEIHKVNCVRLK